MEQTQQREKKWGLWLYMLNFFSLDSIFRLLLRTVLHSDENSFGHHLISFLIAIGLTIGIFYALRYRPWKVKVWTTGAIIIISLLARILSAM
ncbi:hypothetical protein LZD49_20080 [Dyadobacter sp. CY261]|uniref:hypothetical protein n=1 Tax=Dyadobacter sp. CY261 TaxID=2907203 RepID=UPI001F293592|nr:hypothetical protein [Dyadobacter sp. CY261]MCF0072790.1 hypothetical protein [Dyadobacter sp. CY261]